VFREATRRGLLLLEGKRGDDPIRGGEGRRGHPSEEKGEGKSEMELISFVRIAEKSRRCCFFCLQARFSFLANFLTVKSWTCGLYSHNETNPLGSIWILYELVAAPFSSSGPALFSSSSTPLPRELAASAFLA